MQLPLSSLASWAGEQRGAPFSTEQVPIVAEKMTIPKTFISLLVPGRVL